MRAGTPSNTQAARQLPAWPSSCDPDWHSVHRRLPKGAPQRRQAKMGSMVAIRAAHSSHTKAPGRSQAAQRVGERSSSAAARARSHEVDDRPKSTKPPCRQWQEGLNQAYTHAQSRRRASARDALSTRQMECCRRFQRHRRRLHAACANDDGDGAGPARPMSHRQKPARQHAPLRHHRDDGA